VIIDHTNRRVLDVLESREKETVIEWLAARRDSGLLSQVEEVTTDMWEAYAQAARTVFGDDVRIVIDRFHVMKNFQDQLENARRTIQRELPAEAAQALKGTRWLWITNPENLDPEQRRDLEELGRFIPELGRLHDLRERLRSIFEDHRVQRPATAIDRFRDWIDTARRTGLNAVEHFCGTLERWMEGIANYFVDRSSNGRTEGFNHGLRVVLWRAFGLRNFQHFRLRVLDSFGQPRPQQSTGVA
jgi:transposase